MRSAIRRALALMILAAAPGCDNVDWGGAEFAVVKPPPQATTNPRASGDPEADQLPAGPVLYYVSRSGSGSSATLSPIAEIAGDSMRALTAARDPADYAQRFIADFLRTEAEFILFRRGERAGLFVLDTANASFDARCGPTPSATGTLRLDGDYADETEFLAFSRLHAPQVARRIDSGVQPTANMPILSPILAEQMLRERGAPLPGNWRRALAQLVAFPVMGAQSPGFTSTFVVGDTLGPGLDNEGYALFYVASPAAAQVGWDTVFVDFRDYRSIGKAAPRLVDFLDWNRDEQVDLILRVYGINDAWFEAVARTPAGTWQTTFDGRCQAAASPPPAPAPPPAGQTGAAATPPDTSQAAASPPDTGQAAGGERTPAGG